MAIPTAAISGAVTIVIVSWLFRLARRPVPTLPDGSIVVRYGRGMLAVGMLWGVVLAVGMLCGVLVPIGLVGLVLKAGFRTPEDPYYFGGMVVFFLVLGWWVLLESLKRRVIVSDSGLVSNSPWHREPTRLAWTEVAQMKFSPTSGQLVFVNRSGGKIRVGTLMSSLDQLITAARQRVPADVSRDALAKLEQRRSRGGG